MNKQVLYLVQSIPGDNAPTKHAFAISDLLVKCGFNVHFVLAGIIEPSSNAISSNYDYPFDFPYEVKFGHHQIAKKYYERISLPSALKPSLDVSIKYSPTWLFITGYNISLQNGF